MLSEAGISHGEIPAKSKHPYLQFNGGNRDSSLRSE
jgi:hypothetical protein